MYVQKVMHKKLGNHEGHWQKAQDPEQPLVPSQGPDPYQNVMDPEHCFISCTVQFNLN